MTVTSSWQGSASPPNEAATPATGASGATIRNKVSAVLAGEERRQPGEERDHEEPEQPGTPEGRHRDQEPRGLGRDAEPADQPLGDAAPRRLDVGPDRGPGPVDGLVGHQLAEPHPAVRAVDEVGLDRRADDA